MQDQAVKRGPGRPRKTEHNFQPVLIPQPKPKAAAPAAVSDPPPKRRGRPSKGVRLHYVAGRDEWRIIDGKTQIGVARGAGNRELAEKALASYLTGTRFELEDKDAKKCPVSKLLNIYARDKAAEFNAPETAGYSLSHLLTFFDGKVVADLTPRTCDEYVRFRTQQRNPNYKKNPENAPFISVTTAKRELNYLSAAVNHGFKNNLVDRPIKLDLPGDRKRRERWLTRSEAATLLAGALGFYRDEQGKIRRNRGVPLWSPAGAPLRYEGISKHLARFILIALYTATRKSAVLNLTWEKRPDTGYVDFDAGLIYRMGEDEEVTNKRREPVPIPPRLMPHLQRWKRLGSTSGHVIEYRGAPISSGIKTVWRGARERAGLNEDVVPHVLKHTCITWMLQAGIPMWQVAGFASTTEDVIRRVYGHHCPTTLRDAAEVFSNRPGAGAGNFRGNKFAR